MLASMRAASLALALCAACGGSPVKLKNLRCRAVCQDVEDPFKVRLSVDFDAAWLGNGCSAGQAAGEQIAPVNERFGPLVCPTNTPASNCGVGTDAPEVNP